MYLNLWKTGFKPSLYKIFKENKLKTIIKTCLTGFKPVIYEIFIVYVPEPLKNRLLNQLNIQRTGFQNWFDWFKHVFRTSFEH